MKRSIGSVQSPTPVSRAHSAPRSQTSRRTSAPPRGRASEPQRALRLRHPPFGSQRRAPVSDSPLNAAAAVATRRARRVPPLLCSVSPKSRGAGFSTTDVFFRIHSPGNACLSSPPRIATPDERERFSEEPFFASRLLTHSTRSHDRAHSRGKSALSVRAIEISTTRDELASRLRRNPCKSGRRRGRESRRSVG